MASGSEDDSPGVSDRLSRIRETINRREKKVRADRQARERRVERGEAEGRREEAQVKYRAAKDEAELSAEEARELATDAKTLISTELGVDSEKSESIIKKGAAVLDEAGSQIGSLDLDGDGDTDLLTGLDQPLGGGGGGSSGRQTRGFDPTKPIFNPSEDDADISDPISDLGNASEPIVDFSNDRT